jgi:hypothetical protein
VNAFAKRFGGGGHAMAGLRCCRHARSGADLVVRRRGPSGGAGVAGPTGLRFDGVFPVSRLT